MSLPLPTETAQGSLTTPATVPDTIHNPLGSPDPHVRPTGGRCTSLRARTGDRGAPEGVLSRLSWALGIARLADEGTDGRHLQDGLQAVERQEHGAEDGVCPEHQGLPEQEVDRQQGAGRCEDQAGGQQHLGLYQVALGAWREHTW